MAKSGSVIAEILLTLYFCGGGGRFDGGGGGGGVGSGGCGGCGGLKS